jgi:hypothetical protein
MRSLRSIAIAAATRSTTTRHAGVLPHVRVFLLGKLLLFGSLDKKYVGQVVSYDLGEEPTVSWT